MPETTIEKIYTTVNGDSVLTVSRKTGSGSGWNLITIALYKGGTYLGYCTLANSEARELAHFLYELTHDKLIYGESDE